MSYDEEVDLTAAPGATINDRGEVEATLAPKKRTVREFLNRYRSLGLPGHKKARRARRIAVLQAERDFMSEMVRRAALLNARANTLLRAVIDESNFVIDTREHEGMEEDGPVIFWVADDTVLENARKYLADFPTSGKTQPLPPPDHSQESIATPDSSAS